MQAVRSGRQQGAAASDRVRLLWDLFAAHGSNRVIAAIAEELGLATRSCLPKPIRGLDDAQRVRIRRVLEPLALVR